MKALTDLFNAVSAISEESRTNGEISAYQLVPCQPETDLFDKVSDLVGELDAIGAKPYGENNDNNNNNNDNNNDSNGKTTSRGARDDNTCAKTILFLSAISRSSPSSAVKNDIQRLPSLSQARSSFSLDHPLHHAENIFNVDPGWTFPGFSLQTKTKYKMCRH